MEITLKCKRLTIKLVEVLEEHNLYLGQGGGMSHWFDAVRSGKPNWMGKPPRYVIVAYNKDGVPVGWCGIATGYNLYRTYDDYSERDSEAVPVGVVATFVSPFWRKKGLATMLLKETLRKYKNNKSEIIALDYYGWDCAKHIKEAGYYPATYMGRLPKELDNVS